MSLECSRTRAIGRPGLALPGPVPAWPGTVRAGLCVSRPARPGQWVAWMAWPDQYVAQPGPAWPGPARVKPSLISIGASLTNQV